jgi:SWIM/SEC-C metal-binding protein
MAKSGSKGNPLILRVADESKAQLVAEICSENDWQFILGIEPDQEEDLSDLERKLNPPVRHEVRKIGRNEPCTCGSEKKFKKCCGANV